MKSLTQYIKESKTVIDDIDKYYINISDLKNNDNIILCWIDEDGYAEPFNVVVKKQGDNAIFVNPDDESDVMTWKDFVNSADANDKNPQVAVFKDVKEAEAFCNHYNAIYDM